MFDLIDRAASLYITLYDALIVPGLIVATIGTIVFCRNAGIYLLPSSPLFTA